MLEHSVMPSLTFADIVYSGSETPLNLNIFLYNGGAAANRKFAQRHLAQGKFGDMLTERLSLVSALHAEISAALAGGGSRETGESTVNALRKLFAFADQRSLPLTLDSITSTYLAWTDSLHHRTMLKNSARPDSSEFTPLGRASAFQYASTCGTLIDRILERHSTIIQLTRLKRPNPRKSPLGVQADKQNLEYTFTFGRALQNICDGLSLAVTLEAPLPVCIQMPEGKEFFWGGKRVPRNSEQSLPGGRDYLVNLRVEAELLMFIGQTGMNVTQAAGLELRHFFYVSHLDSYQVKEHKARRQGTVLFEIFKEYKPHFERYLEWRRNIFPNSNRIFPFMRRADTREDTRFQGHRVRGLCDSLNILFVPARELRNTRVNWLLRQSANPELTAEMAQHTEATLLAVYNRPSLQTAMVEVTRFWGKADPHLSKTDSVAPGGCTGTPVAVPDLPPSAPKPDCSRAAGCLWCENHRDVDTQEHVWALASFKYLKVVELSKIRRPASDVSVPPAKLVIDRIDAKMIWYAQSNTRRAEWVEEAEARIDEEDFHPDFMNEITSAEAGI